MDPIAKALQRLSPKERGWVKTILERLRDQNLAGIDIKKLKGRNDIFRVRKGDLRIIYRTDKTGRIFILRIDRRNKNTYAF